MRFAGFRVGLVERRDTAGEAAEDPLAGPGDLGFGEEAVDVEVREGLQGGLKALQGVRAWHEIQALCLQLFGHRPGKSANGKVNFELRFGHRDFRVKAIAQMQMVTAYIPKMKSIGFQAKHGGVGATAMMAIVVFNVFPPIHGRS